MKEIKGLITIPLNRHGNKETTHLTCCSFLPKVMIGDVNLHDFLNGLFNTDTEAEFGYGDEAEEKRKLHQIDLAVKYCITDNPEDLNMSFNDLSATIINAFMSPDYISGCYSEYTCGYGDFDFLVNDHSIFTELEGYEGRYIFMQI